MLWGNGGDYSAECQLKLRKLRHAESTNKRASSGWEHQPDLFDNAVQFYDNLDLH